MQKIGYIRNIYIFSVFIFTIWAYENICIILSIISQRSNDNIRYSTYNKERWKENTTTSMIDFVWEYHRFCFLWLRKSAYSRIPQDMDGTLTLIFANFYTIWSSATKISALLQLRKKWILTKFEGRGSKNGPAMPIWSFRPFWREIQIQGTKRLQI